MRAMLIALGYFGQILVRLALAGGFALGISGVAAAQTAAAQFLAAGSGVSSYASGDVEAKFHLSQAVPYRVYALTGPARLVVDFRDVGWEGMNSDGFLGTDRVKSVRYGTFRPGWSRAVLRLAQPMLVHMAGMEVSAEDGDAVLTVRLTAGSEQQVEAVARPRDTGLWALAPPAELATPAGAAGLPLIVLDPGHGGVDPGAQHGGFDEADVMLGFAKRLRDILVLSGRYQVLMTRDDDRFVSLDDRVSLARGAGAAAFISLHADALASGSASGTTVYTLSDVASDAASRKLAASHARDDLLSGVSLGAADDQIADVLMDLARTETSPRSDRLADALVQGIGQSVGKMRRRPHLSAGFSVLRAPDIPSVLIEVGFLSNPLDRANLTSADWQDKVAQGILDALDDWSVDDAARQQLLRQ